MYKNIIEEVANDISYKTEEGIMKAVYELGFNIDKQELTKLLKGDRDSYKRGYMDGFQDAINNLLNEQQWYLKMYGPVEDEK